MGCGFEGEKEEYESLLLSSLPPPTTTSSSPTHLSTPTTHLSTPTTSSSPLPRGPSRLLLLLLLFFHTEVTGDSSRHSDDKPHHSDDIRQFHADLDAFELRKGKNCANFRFIGRYFRF
ncbi:hypothetical protein HanPI659440_Chr03g0116281 [Helianthus annuus]|nr:hypothetical protein HanPI659440_Chr03g0116281 [Helianthus annuus]